MSGTVGTLRNMELAVYVPAGAATSIDPGSGVVASPVDGGRLLADYEGNRYNARNLVTYADRVSVAASRHTDRYPTVARVLLPATALTRVGTFDTRTGEVTLEDGDEPGCAVALVTAWCSLPRSEIPAQLRSTGARYELRRQIAAALASPDPRVRALGQQMARRHRIEL